MKPTQTEGKTTLAALIVLAAATGCGDLAALREENAALRLEIEALRKATGVSRIGEFTVGIAAVDEDFDEGAFSELLRTSLEESSVEPISFRVAPERDERQVAKMRGILLQQYLREQKIPVRISSLTYKVRDPRGGFVIGGALVPSEGVVVEPAGDDLFRCTYEDPLDVTMLRDAAGRYAVEYEGSSGERGRVTIELDDSQLHHLGPEPRAAREGDISFAWQPGIERILVYSVSDFQGDLGTFLERMRYPRSRIELNQYQTVRDSVFLFGYGPYATGLVQQLRTPGYIDRVEVMPISPEVFAQLDPGLSREQLEELVAARRGDWLECEFLDTAGTEKVWERPVEIHVPFLSRQTSGEKRSVFFTKYSAEGPRLIGDYTTR